MSLKGQIKTAKLIGGPNNGMEIQYGKFEPWPSNIVFQKNEKGRFYLDTYLRKDDIDKYIFQESS